MRILLLADVHANWPALQAITEPHDLCLCLGDLVDYGLDPAPCVDWARHNALITMRGNHDHGVAQNVPVSGRNGYKYLTGVTRPLSRERLSAGRDGAVEGWRFARSGERGILRAGEAYRKRQSKNQ